MANYRKVIVTLLAITSIAVAIYGFWQLGIKINEKPIRQTEEIR
jgi:hypothetical protein